MPTVRTIFIDTNILVYSSTNTSPFHAQATQRLNDLYNQNVELWISRQILREYVAVMTKQPLTKTIPIATLESDVCTYLRLFQVAEDTQNVTDRWLALIKQIPTGGKQIHDANIAATMLTYGITDLLTHNVADFNRFSAFITLVPLLP
jgi:predicted nucleic acid-binding protein